jgi:hypothetical protein
MGMMKRKPAVQLTLLFGGGWVVGSRTPGHGNQPAQHQAGNSPHPADPFGSHRRSLLALARSSFTRRDRFDACGRPCRDRSDGGGVRLGCCPGTDPTRGDVTVAS